MSLALCDRSVFFMESEIVNLRVLHEGIGQGELGRVEWVLKMGPDQFDKQPRRDRDRDR